MPLEYVKKSNGREYTIEYFTAMNGKTIVANIYSGHRQPRTATQKGVEGHLLVEGLCKDNLKQVVDFISKKICREKVESKDQTGLDKWMVSKNE